MMMDLIKKNWEDTARETIKISPGVVAVVNKIITPILIYKMRKSPEQHLYKTSIEQKYGEEIISYPPIQHKSGQNKRQQGEPWMAKHKQFLLVFGALFFLCFSTIASAAVQKGISKNVNTDLEHKF